MQERWQIQIYCDCQLHLEWRFLYFQWHFSSPFRCYNRIPKLYNSWRTDICFIVVGFRKSKIKLKIASMYWGLWCETEKRVVCTRVCLHVCVHVHMCAYACVGVCVCVSQAGSWTCCFVIKPPLQQWYPFSLVMFSWPRLVLVALKWTLAVAICLLPLCKKRRNGKIFVLSESIM